MIERFAWLHVSDFHFRASGDPFSQTVACNALIEDIKSRVADHAPMSFILLTGDIAYSGQRAEYSRAAPFMNDLVAAAGLDLSRLFLIPGNHDVDRGVHEFAHAGAVAMLSSQAEVDRTLGNPSRLSDLRERQSAYFEFVEGLAGSHDRIPTPDRLGYVALVDIDALRVAIIGLNSAWLCGKDSEATSLIIGERQIIEAMNLVRAANPHLLIAMAHHPIEWLVDWDQQTCRDRLLRTIHFFHRGHLHEPDVATAPNRPCIVVAAGSAHSGRFYPNAYNVVSLDLGAAAATVHAYRYRPGQGSFEPLPPVSAPCDLGGDMPGTPNELTAAIAATLPVGAITPRYMGALLSGQKDEVPIRVEERIDFVPADVAVATDLEQGTPVSEFLRLRNLLRLRDPLISLTNRVAMFSDTLNRFDGYLRGCVEMDQLCRDRIRDSPVLGEEPTTSLHGGMPQTEALLVELRNTEQWGLLEAQARRSFSRGDARLVRLAKSCLAQSLMHSDEGDKRQQAVTLAEELASAPNATADDYLLAAGASDVVGSTSRAAELTRAAVSRWPGYAPLMRYARDLVTRSGDATLRAAIEAASIQGSSP